MNGVKDLAPSGKTHLNSVMGLIADTLKKKDDKDQRKPDAPDKSVDTANLAKMNQESVKGSKANKTADAKASDVAAKAANSTEFHRENKTEEEKKYVYKTPTKD